jgi:hypothetical protein
MDFNKTVDLIIKDLEEAREIIDDLKNYPGVPLIQVELAKSKCSNAAGIISLFKNQQSLAQKDAIKETAAGEPVKKETAVEKKEVIHQPSAAVSTHEPPKQKPAPTNRKPETGIVADTFINLPDSINEKLGSLREEEDIPDYLKSKPLANLSQAIGVNDRFLFIRELFDGNPDSYNQAILKIDNAGTIADAKMLIISFAGEKKDSEAARQLLDLVKRKFPGNE